MTEIRTLRKVTTETAKAIQFSGNLESIKEILRHLPGQEVVIRSDRVTIGRPGHNGIAIGPGSWVVIWPNGNCGISNALDCIEGWVLEP